MIDSFFPARCIYAQNFENYNRAEDSEQKSQSPDEKADRMERSRAGEELKSFVTRIGSMPNAPKGYENGWSNSWESWLTNPDTKLNDISQTIGFIKDLASNHIRGVRAEKLGDELAKDPNLSLPAKLRLAELRRDYENAKGNEGKAGSEQAKLDFEAFVTEQVGRQQMTKMQLSEYEELANLPGMKETAQGMTLATSSEKGFSGTLQGLIPKEKFLSLNSEQKKAYINLLKKTLKGAPEGNASVEGKKQQILADSSVPKNWKEWLKNPNDPKWGLDKEGKKWTAASIAEWIGEELPNLKLSTGRYERILTEGHHTINKNGIQTRSVEEFQKLSRSERNEYLDSLQGRLASVDTEFAKRMETAKVVEGKEVKTIGTEMAESAKKQEEKVAKKVVTLGKSLEKNTVALSLKNKFTQRRAELEKRTQSSDLADDTTNLRRQAAEGGTSPLKMLFAQTPLARFFGGKKESAANENSDPKISEQQRNEKQRLDNEASNQIVTEVMGDGRENKGDQNAQQEVQKIFGLTSSATREDTANFMKLLTQYNFQTDHKAIQELFTNDNHPFKRVLNSGKSNLLDDEPQTQKAA